MFFVAIVLLGFGCSPKVRPVATATKTEAPVVKKEPEKVAEKPAATKVSSIAMLLPFSLDNLNTGAQYTSSTLSHANLSVDYYQGFKLALDSLTGQGYNYKLQVFDTKEDAAQAHSLAYNPAIRTSDLIVGPVFPDDLKRISVILTWQVREKLFRLYLRFRLLRLQLYKDQSLITVATPLEYHAWAAAQYISEHYKPKKVFVLKSGFSEENAYLTPFQKGYWIAPAKVRSKMISATIVHGRPGWVDPAAFCNRGKCVCDTCY